MKEKNGLRIINVLGFVFLLLASLVFARGDMFSGDIMPLFMPAPYTFSIWILIYILLGIWLISTFIKPDESGYEAVGYWFVACMVFSGLSILVPTQYSAFFIVGALISILVCYKKLRANKEVSTLSIVPFSILAGWLSVATIADISIVLRNMGITEIAGIGEVGWTIIMLAVGTAIAMIFSIIEKDNLYPLVYVWGYIGIAVQNKNIDAIIRMALMMSFILVVSIVYNWYQKKTLL